MRQSSWHYVNETSYYTGVDPAAWARQHSLKGRLECDRFKSLETHDVLSALISHHSLFCKKIWEVGINSRFKWVILRVRKKLSSKAPCYEAYNC
jgi:hypothetical protein